MNRRRFQQRLSRLLKGEFRPRRADIGYESQAPYCGVVRTVSHWPAGIRSNIAGRVQAPLRFEAEPDGERSDSRARFVSGSAIKVSRRHNVKLNIVVQETTGASKIGGSFQLLTGLIQAARGLLAPHAIDFRHGPFALPCVGAVIPDDDDQVDATTLGNALSLRKLAEAAQQVPANTLRIILCPFLAGRGATGVTFGGAEQSPPFASFGPRFCLIDCLARRPDQGTLLHEMIHAANPIISPLDTDNEPQSIFSHSKTAFRTFLSERRAAELARGFFCGVTVNLTTGRHASGELNCVCCHPDA